MYVRRFLFSVKETWERWIYLFSSGVIRWHVLLKAFTLSNQRALQDDAAFLVALAVFSSKLVDPSQFAIAVFAAHIPNHVAAGEHDPILNFTVLQVNYLVKKKCSTSGACEPSRDEF